MRGILLDGLTAAVSLLVALALYPLAIRLLRRAKAGQVILSEIWGKKGAIGLVPPDGEGALVTSHFFLFEKDEALADRRYIDWVLDDPAGRPVEEVRATRDDIDRRVAALIEDLDRSSN